MMTDTPQHLQEAYDTRVSHGARVLDELLGEGWHVDIDTGQLAMEDCEVCIIGQAVPKWFFEQSYVTERSSFYLFGLSFGSLAVQDCGFDLDHYGYADDMPRIGAGEVQMHWQALEEAWVRELKRRWTE